MLDISARYIHICTVPPVATSPKKKGSHQDENNPVHSLKPFKYYIHVAPPSDINIHMLRVLAVAMNEISHQPHPIFTLNGKKIRLYGTILADQYWHGALQSIALDIRLAIPYASFRSASMHLYTAHTLPIPMPPTVTPNPSSYRRKKCNTTHLAAVNPHTPRGQANGTKSMK